jgi:predicted small lipoprotein YifL
MKPLALIALLALAACGADGEPLQPGHSDTAIKVSGDARFGIQTRLN